MLQVNAVVAEALKMRRERQGAKAVVFSTWSRLLKVISTHQQMLICRGLGLGLGLRV